MKRLISVLLSIALVMSAGADSAEFLLCNAFGNNTATNAAVQEVFPGTDNTSTITLSEFVSTLNAMSTKEFRSWETKVKLDTNGLAWRKRNDADFMAEFDALAAENPFIKVFKRSLSTNAFENVLQMYRKAGNTNIVAVATETGAASYDGMFKNNLGNAARCISDVVYTDFYRKMVLDAYMRELKIWFRKNGKSFVTKNGVNPLKTYMDDLSAALDAPRLGNINELMAKIDRSDVVFDMSFLPNDTLVEETKQKVLIDEIPFACAKSTLRLCLGVEEYNKFVDLYNNGVTNP